MTTFFTDHYFQIGALAVVSDGCSGGRHTDVGARLVGLSTVTALRDHWTMNQNIDSAHTPADIALRVRMQQAQLYTALGLEGCDMLATQSYIYLSHSGGIVHVHGDGVISLMHTDGTIVMHNIAWHDNMPHYPAYTNADTAQFIAAHGGDVHAVRMHEDVWRRSPEGEFSCEEENAYTLAQGLQGKTLVITPEMLAQLSFVMIFSDGVGQIDGMNWRDAVALFCAFKNTTGAFAKRRMIRGIKETETFGRGPLDDMAYAVVGITHDGGEDNDTD